MTTRAWFLVFLFAATATTASAREVSLINLIATPTAFHAKPVVILGFLHSEREGDAVYLHRDDWEQGIAKNGLWIDVDSIPVERLKELNNRYVLVEGTFDMVNQGHLGSWSGSIHRITRIEALRPLPSQQAPGRVN
ncbi:hypothetical protein [Roseateles sp.]|uniref:hypothetical protein n=1 Tax=Roseateles sp. TaxID=1971397 RepID=UPI002F3E5E04